MRLSAPSLALILAGGLAHAGGLGEMSDAERQAFRDEVRSFLVENPDVIVEALNILQQREEQAAAEQDITLVKDNREAIFNAGTDWIGGNPEGDITLVEFMDYRCSYCRKAHDEVNDLVTSDGRIRYIVKEFPILGEGSLLSSQYAIATRMIYGDEAYKAAHDALITLRGEPDPATLTRIAEGFGQDSAALLAKMQSSEVQDVIAANHALATTMQISGTPTFVIEGTMLRGYVPLDGMRQIVAEERG
jgi:protein-disulfide isomerase